MEKLHVNINWVAKKPLYNLYNHCYTAYERHTSIIKYIVNNIIVKRTNYYDNATQCN